MHTDEKSKCAAPIGAKFSNTYIASIKKIEYIDNAFKNEINLTADPGTS